MVALLIIAVVLLALVTLQVRALNTVALSKQRQQATAFANRTMEQLRALPYDTVAGGLLASDLTGDPNIVSGMFHPTSYTNTISERIVSNASVSTVPLYPHRQSGAAINVSNAQYTISSYVTLASTVAGDTTAGYWLTVIVTWTSGSSGGAPKIVSSRSRLYSPTGCLATATHPFSGPCQAFYDGAATSTPATLSLTSDGPSGSPALAGNALLSGNVTSAGVSAGVQAEQTVSVQGKATTSGADYSDTTPSQPRVGSNAATTGASTDPATGTASDPATAPVSQAPTASMSKPGANSSFALQAGASDTGEAASTTAATSTTGCKNVSDAVITSGQACGSGKVTPNGSMLANLAYGSPIFNPQNTIPLASMDTAASPSRAFTARYLTSGAPYCTAAAGTGCISSDVKRSVGDARVGGIPTGALTPAFALGWTGAMVRVTGYNDEAKAEAGPTAGSTTRAGSLAYWSSTGSPTGLSPGYAPLNLSSAPAGTYPLAPVTATYLGPSGVLVTITMTGSVRITAGAATPTGTAPCQAPACGMTANAGSVVASVSYLMQTPTAQVGAFTVRLDLGSALAKTSYRAAPSA